MNVNRFFSLLLTVAVVMVAGIAVSAQTGPQVGNPFSDSRLELSANARTALQVDITTAGGGATVVGPTNNGSNGIFTMDFGDVNGLGLGTPTAGVTVAVQAGGALYTSPITLTPRYSNFITATSSISVVMDGTAGNASGRTATREGATAGGVGAPSTTIPNVFTTAATNGTALTRHVGFFVSNTNGAGAVNGALQSRLVYQISVP